MIAIVIAGRLVVPNSWAWAQEPAPPATDERADDLIRCRNGVVVSVSAAASQAGLRVLERGGSAVDGAVATAFALAVTYPAAGNIGGGGYLLVVPSDLADSIAFDFRETAPAASTPHMFANPAERTPHRRVGVPGTVGGLAMAHQRFGKLPWRELVLPAVELARQGFFIDAAVAADLNRVMSQSDRMKFATLHSTYGQSDGRACAQAIDWCNRSWETFSRRSQNRAPTPSIQDAWPN